MSRPRSTKEDEAAKARGLRLEAAGLCKRCGAAPAAEGLKQCRPCLDHVNANRTPSPPSFRSAGELNECCCAFGFHRFDCRAVPLAKREPGPVLPTVAPC